jgi:hypothetical protein
MEHEPEPERIVYVGIKVQGAYDRWMQELAEREHRSRSSLIEAALAEYGAKRGSPPPDRVPRRIKPRNSDERWPIG